MPSKVPCKVTVDVTQDLHEVGVHGGEGHAGRLPHVDGALLCQVHVVEVDKLELRFFLWPVDNSDMEHSASDALHLHNIMHQIMIHLYLPKTKLQQLPNEHNTLVFMKCGGQDNAISCEMRLSAPSEVSKGVAASADNTEIKAHLCSVLLQVESGQ